MRALTIGEVIALHARLLEQTGGGSGIRDHGALESSVAQPHQTFSGQDLYRSIPAKAAALGFFLISNHPFVDGNKRIGHAAMEVVLLLDSLHLSAAIDEQERVILAVASGTMSIEAFTAWVERRIVV